MDSVSDGANGRHQEPFSSFTHHCSLILILYSLYNEGTCKGFVVNTDTLRNCYLFFLQPSSFQKKTLD